MTTTYQYILNVTKGMSISLAIISSLIGSALVNNFWIRLIIICGILQILLLYIELYNITKTEEKQK